MEAKFEKKLKAFLPYIIIIGIVYLIAPALLFTGSTFVTYLVLIGILPLTAGACCAHCRCLRHGHHLPVYMVRGPHCL